MHYFISCSPTKMMISAYNYKLPELNISKELDEGLLDLLGGIKYRNHCKFLMLVRAYNNKNKDKGILNEGQPYCYFTKNQAAEFIGVDVRTITNIITYLSELGYLHIARGMHKNTCNHVNFYLYNVPEKVEQEKNINLKEIYTGPAELVSEEIEIYTPKEGSFEGNKLDTCLDFYNRIRIPGTKTEISDVRNVFTIDKKNWYFDILTMQCDTYFVGGVDVNKKTRCSDVDIIKKKYFAVDIDIRKDIKKLTGETMSDNQLYGYIDEILRLLDDSDFGDYDEVVMSGNGVHIYYIGTPRVFDKEIYKAGVARIFHDIDSIIAPLGLKTDKAVSNISSLFRCPGTVNYGRETKYGLEKDFCFVYKRQEGGGQTFDSIELVAAQSLSEEQERINKRKLLQIETTKFNAKKSGSDVFETINAIPLDAIFSGHTGLEISKDGKNFISNKDGKNIGCFYDKEKNILLNMGTHYLNSDDRSYNTFNYVMFEVLGLTQSKESIVATIERFKKNYNI